MTCTQHGKSKEIVSLLTSKSDVNEASRSGNRAVNSSFIFSQEDAFHLLLENRASLDFVAEDTSINSKIKNSTSRRSMWDVYRLYAYHPLTASVFGLHTQTATVLEHSADPCQCNCKG